MRTTLIIEPNPRGHRFQAVSFVAEVARADGDVVLLTSAGAPATDAFSDYLSGTELRVVEQFAEEVPTTSEIASAAADWCRRDDVQTVVLMDADQALKKWWYLARRAFGRQRMPRIVFMLTRYPARIRLSDRFGWSLRVTKGALVLLAMSTGSLHRAVGFAGRDDMSVGWLVKRARDPAVCTSHSRDRAALRAALGLPADAPLVGVFGMINERRNVPVILDAALASGTQAIMVIAGELSPQMRRWFSELPEGHKRQMIVRDEFLSTADLDRFVAAVDVVPIALTNNGPSGIMGKALAAGVPVITAGSRVRAQEIMATGGGEAVELSVESLTAALRRVLSPGYAIRPSGVPAPTGRDFAMTLLGAESVTVRV